MFRYVYARKSQEYVPLPLFIRLTSWKKDRIDIDFRRMGKVYAKL